MARQVIGAALFAAGMVAAGSVGAQGFSGSGAAGAAQSQGLAASPGMQGSAAGDRPAAEAREPRALYRLVHPTDIDFSYPVGQVGAGSQHR